MTRTLTVLAAAATASILISGSAIAKDQPYAGQQAREIASLSEDDVTALLNGEGWGLAKPAELNGYPGPAHILELADDLALSPEQRTQIQAIFDSMQAEARALGAQYVEAEAHLSRMFRTGHASETMLQSMLEQSSQALASLRQAHLSAHLAATPVLSEDQREKYAELRGYGDGAQDHSGHGGHSHD